MSEFFIRSALNEIQTIRRLHPSAITPVVHARLVELRTRLTGPAARAVKDPELAREIERELAQP